MNSIFQSYLIKSDNYTMVDDPEKEQLKAIFDYDFNKENEVSEKKQKSTGFVVVILFFVLVLLVALSLLIDYKPKEQQIEKKPTPLPALITPEKDLISNKERNYIKNNIIFYRYFYQNTVLYPAFCKKNGYNLDKYVAVFNTVFKENIADFNSMNKILGESSPNFKERLDTINDEDMEKIIPAKFDLIRRNLILMKLAAANNTTPDKIEWNDRYYEALDTKLACQYLDDNVYDVLEKSYKAIVPLYEK